MAYKREYCINWKCSKHFSCRLFITPISEQDIKLANRQPKRFDCSFYEKKQVNLIEKGVEKHG